MMTRHFGNKLTVDVQTFIEKVKKSVFINDSYPNGENSGRKVSIVLSSKSKATDPDLYPCRISRFLGLPDPDPLLRGTDPDPSIQSIKQKLCKIVIVTSI
jgi:hypothetical protein